MLKCLYQVERYNFRCYEKGEHVILFNSSLLRLHSPCHHTHLTILNVYAFYLVCLSPFVRPYICVYVSECKLYFIKFIEKLRCSKVWFEMQASKKRNLLLLLLYIIRVHHCSLCVLFAALVYFFFWTPHPPRLMLFLFFSPNQICMNMHFSICRVM